MDILIEEMDSSLWVAALDGGKLDGLEVDPAGEEVRWGSIYRAKVVSVDTALDAVYVDLDGDNTGILFNKDVRRTDKDGKLIKGGAEAIGKALPPGKVITVQAKSAYLAAAKDFEPPREDKLPLMSMDITLPGRHLIYCPMMEINRVSQRIRDKALRKNLLKMLDALEDIRGCILRASAAHTQTDMLMREGKILKGTWEAMQEYLQGNEVGLIMEGPDAIERTLSDQAAQAIDRIEIVTMDHFHQAETWCDLFAPDLMTKIEPVELDNAVVDLALFEYRDIIGQIEDLFHSYAMLAGGGNIIIQETAALTAVDINRGGDKGSNLAINIAAAQEIARQMRLRNAGGIVMVDFLKMNSKRDEGKLIAAMEEAINDDPCTVQIHGMTALGLMEMTRKRRTPPLQERFDLSILTDNF